VREVIAPSAAGVTSPVPRGVRRERLRHAEALSLLGRHDGELGAVVVDYEECMAYCLPGRNGKAGSYRVPAEEAGADSTARFTRGVEPLDAIRPG